MSFRTHHTLTGYARAAVDLKARMDEHVQGSGFREFLDIFLDTPLATDREPRHTGRRVAEAVWHAAGTVWRAGEPFVLAPAMTAVVAAAAQALDLTGEVVTEQVAPCDWGVLFLPEPIYHRGIDGQLWAFAAITWAPVTSPTGRMWLVCGWADRADPEDPHAARVRTAIAQRRELSAMLGPYVLTDFAYLPTGVPVPTRGDLPQEVDQSDRDWETSPEGRYVIAEQDAATRVCVAVLYTFWRIAAQPLATVTRPPLDRPARRRAAPRPCGARRAGGDAAPARHCRHGWQGPGRTAVAVPGAVSRPGPLAPAARPRRQPVPDLDQRLPENPTTPRCCTGRRSPCWPGRPYARQPRSTSSRCLP